MDRWLFAHGEDRKFDATAAGRDVGIDPDWLLKCAERRDLLERAERESAAAVKRHFVGTPTYMVDGKRITADVAERWLAQGRPE
jgi:2-hydroxychromene-2-carboxylate isomerase